MDEFNHNIIDLEGDTDIQVVEFSVHMPKTFNAEKVNCTSGELGSKDNTQIVCGA